MFGEHDFIIDETKDEQEKIKLPYKFKPRDYQLPLFEHLVPELFKSDNPIAKNTVLVWHRRAGKDKCAINILTCRAVIDVPGYYLYMAPEAAQARKIIWEGIGSDGMRFIDHIPPELIKSTRNQDMRIELINGSTIQVAGSDNYDSLVGTNPKGIIFSEYSLQNPAALQYFRPMLVENGGWAVFIYTPRGHNHGYELHKTAQKRMNEGNQDWFHQVVTIDESTREDGSPVVTKEQYEQEIEDGTPKATALQEYYCSFDQGNVGAYYADQIATLNKNGGIGYYPHDPAKTVITAWDLGLNDNCSIWFIQIDDSGPRIIDYESEPNIPLTEWVKIIQEKPYRYYEHIGPHDLNVREMTTATTRLDFLQDAGLAFRVAPKLPRLEGIDAVRKILPICKFNEKTTEEGIECLRAYERVYDAELKTFKETPKHNWASHGADSIRYFAILWDEYRDAVSSQKPHRVILTEGTVKQKGGGLPPLVYGGGVRKNGTYI